MEINAKITRIHEHTLKNKNKDHNKWTHTDYKNINKVCKQ